MAQPLRPWLLALCALLALAGCTEQKATQEVASRQQSPLGDANAQPPGAVPPPSIPPAPPPQAAPEPKDIARATATDIAREPSTVDWSGGDAKEGHDLYGMYCLNCHGADGRGKGPAAAALNPKPRDFTTGVFYIDASANNETGEDVDLARVIREGPARFGGSPAMPPAKAFSDQQIRDLVAYVHQLARAQGG